jgi:peptidoglycan/xylan/chitin deacetylase (PgdA/CDA1 family)
MSNLKLSLLKLLLSPGATVPFRPFVKEKAVIFTLHRFRHPPLGIDDDDPLQVRMYLNHLRKKRYNLVSLEDLFQSLAEGRPLARAVVFTIDDGYHEQATVGCPLFAEFDCPVTTFVTTGFLDGSLWFWWDQIECVFKNTTCKELVTTLGGIELTYPCDTEDGRSLAQANFTARCKEVTDKVKVEGIRVLAEQAGVELPEHPPPQYAPMTWEQARACERQGMTFGPHTVTHPILSRTTDEQSEWEIVHCWERLRAEVSHPVPIFCYPNGQLADFGRRELETFGRLGMIGGVTGKPGYADARAFRGSSEGRFKIPRFGCQNALPYLVQCVSGFERFKQLLRGEAS